MKPQNRQPGSARGAPLEMVGGSAGTNGKQQIADQNGLQQKASSANKMTQQQSKKPTQVVTNGQQSATVQGQQMQVPPKPTSAGIGQQSKPLNQGSAPRFVNFQKMQQTRHQPSASDQTGVQQPHQGSNPQSQYGQGMKAYQNGFKASGTSQKNMLINSQRFNTNIMKIHPQPVGQPQAQSPNFGTIQPPQTDFPMSQRGPRSNGTPQNTLQPQNNGNRRQRNQFVAKSLNVRNQPFNNSQQLNGSQSMPQGQASLSSRDARKQPNIIQGISHSGKNIHQRNHTNDDRVMEVEGFEAQNNGNTSHGQNTNDTFELAASKPLNSSRVMINRRFQQHQEKANQYGTIQDPSVFNSKMNAQNSLGSYGKMMKGGQPNMGTQHLVPVNRSMNSSNGQMPQQQPVGNPQNSHRTLRPKTGENVGFSAKNVKNAPQQISQTLQNSSRGQNPNRQPYSSGGEGQGLVKQSSRTKPNRSEHRQETMNPQLKLQTLSPLANQNSQRAATGGKMMLSPVNSHSNGQFANMGQGQNYIAPQHGVGGQQQVPQSHRELYLNNRPFSHGDNSNGSRTGGQKNLLQQQQNQSGQNQGININIHKYKEKRQAKYNQQSLNGANHAENFQDQILTQRAGSVPDQDIGGKVSQSRDFKSSRGSRGHRQGSQEQPGESLFMQNRPAAANNMNRAELNKSHDFFKGNQTKQKERRTNNFLINSTNESLNPQQQVQLSRKLLSSQQQSRKHGKDPTIKQITEQTNSFDNRQPSDIQNRAVQQSPNNSKQKQQNDTVQNIPDPQVKLTNERFNCITKFAFATSVGHQPGNPYKQNQDSYILVPNMLGQLGLHFFSVCDGHGLNGHHVSQYIKERLPQLMEKRLEKDKDYLSNDRIKEMYEKIPAYMHSSFMQVHEELLKQKYDVQLSGTTCVAVLFDRNTIFCGNAGDSRAVLYAYNKQQSGIKITALSEDHKPCMQVEKKRVLARGGRVDTIKGAQGQNLGPMRVWLMEQDAPGLAMSRSVGDFIAHSVGVATEPEVKRFELQPEDKFMIIASDGVWEFLSNEAIAKIVWPYYLKNSPEQAGNAIVRAAAQKWRENDTVIDDITCVTIFLEVDHQIPKITSAVYKKALINSSTEFENAIPIQLNTPGGKTPRSLQGGSPSIHSAPRDHKAGSSPKKMSPLKA